MLVVIVVVMVGMSRDDDDSSGGGGDERRWWWAQWVAVCVVEVASCPQFPPLRLRSPTRWCSWWPTSRSEASEASPSAAFFSALDPKRGGGGGGMSLVPHSRTGINSPHISHRLNLNIFRKF